MIQKQLGKRISECRRQLGFTQEQFAEKCDYSVEFVSLVERGINSPSVSGLARMARVLGVRVMDLFDFKGTSDK